MDGFSLIELETVIMFKIKAWLDLKERKEAGEDVDTKNIRMTSLGFLPMDLLQAGLNPHGIFKMMLLNSLHKSRKTNLI